MSKYCFELVATDENDFKKIEKVIENLKNQIILMSLKREQTDQVFKLVDNLIDTYSESVKAVLSRNGSKLIENIDALHRRLKKTIGDYDTDFKRKKQIEKNIFYVPPEEKSIGFKWTQTFDDSSQKIIRKYQQNTFQFIRPSAIIQALFLNPVFVKMYKGHVENKGHECTNDVFRDFCCGSHSIASEFMRENPTAMKIQLFTDDFEPCDALKSKAGKHKKCAFYMTIRNMPKKLQSKLSNIFLIALADTIDLKNESASFNNIIEVILEDLKMLETIGIKVAGGETIKACLINMCFDNLGANVCYGLAQGFQANYFCRFCVCHKNECKVLTKEVPEKLRDIDSYNEICTRIIEEENLDLTETKGVREYCKLNDLKNFHIFSNYSVDPMHDLLEGVAPFTLSCIFEYCFKNKVFNLSQLQNMIQFYNYGFLNKRNIPSKIRIDSKNLGQNATQLYCLITHIPFILFSYKNQLKNIWNLVESLFHILEIVFSEEISKSDLIRLELEIERHTKIVLNNDKVLIPKHHFMLHYPRVIRVMGPTVFTSAMRLEAKHQELKSVAQKTKNFINLNKTIAEKHQLFVCLKKNKYCDEIEPGMDQFVLGESDDFEDYKSCTTLQGNEVVIKSLQVNNLCFKTGLLVLHKSIFFQISHVLRSSDRSSFLFLCDASFDIKEKDSFCNSLIIQENQSFHHLLNLNEIENMKCYQKVFVDGKIHVVCNKLELSKLCSII